MSPRAKTLLLAAMSVWTALTVIAGWYAVDGMAAYNGDPSERDALAAATTTAAERTPGALTRTVVGRTATPGLSTATPVGGAGDPTASATQSAESFEPWSTPTPHPYPIPHYVQDAGIDGSAADANGGPDSRSRDAARTPHKGVVVLDPGHGRGDPGAVHRAAGGSADVLEAQSNLQNAILIRNELAALGYDVYLTRDGAGRGPDGPLAQQFIVSDLLWRAQLAAAVDADVYLALHGNGATVTSISGPETWYCGQHEQGSANARLAAMVQQATMDALHEYGYFPPNRGIMEDAQRHHSGDFCQFVVTRETTVPSALLEFLFLTNDDDARVLADDRTHEILAKHVAAAIDGFLTERRGG